jgi:hypothetical protein
VQDAEAMYIWAPAPGTHNLQQRASVDYLMTGHTQTANTESESRPEVAKFETVSKVDFGMYISDLY